MNHSVVIYKLFNKYIFDKCKLCFMMKLIKLKLIKMKWNMKMIEIEKCNNKNWNEKYKIKNIN